MLRNNTIILPLILLLSFACWLCVCQSTTAAGHDEEQVVSIFQNMLNYFNEHSFESQSGKPAPAFYDIVNDIKGRAESQASNTNQPAAAAEPNTANIALSNNPAHVVANAAVPPANNAPSVQGVRSAIVQPASARIDSAAPIVVAPAAAVAPVVAPASVISPANNQPIALAAPPINRAAVEPAANEKNIILEPVTNRVDTAAPAVIPAAPAVIPAAPVVAPVESAVAPVASAAAPAEQAKEVSPSVKPDVVAVPLVPVTSVAVQPPSATIVPVIPPTLTSGTLVSSVPSTTHATAPTSSSMMNTASVITTASLTRSMTSSVTLSRSATPSSTTTIPSISAGVSLFGMSFTKTLSMTIFTVLLLQAIA